MIIRTLLQKSKRILALREIYDCTKNIDQTIDSFRPSIFWKEKEAVKKQTIEWNKDEIKKLLFNTNKVELLIKNNSLSSMNILYDFLHSFGKQVNN
ncbi:MAG: hypothetical protein CBC78_000485 [Candidatus Pelagibacter sp. TMED118]|nr:MAG: hypothetical protein CBC78_000485 [Candidatus Pelagibacter sp. TMED118]